MDRYQGRQTTSLFDTRSSYHTANPKSSDRDESLPKKRLDELSTEFSLERMRYHDYPNETHLSIRKKYSPNTVHYALRSTKQITPSQSDRPETSRKNSSVFPI